MDLLIVSVTFKPVERKEKVQEIRLEMQSDLSLSQLFLRQLMKTRTLMILHSLVFNSQKVQEVRMEMQSDLRLSQLFLRQLMKTWTSMILHILVFYSQILNT